jgi:hypothetical protein
MQTKEEVLRVVRDWSEMYAPSNIIKTEQTAALLVQWIFQNDGEIVSFSGLNRAVVALVARFSHP